MTAVVTLATVRYRLVKDGGTKQVLTGGAKGEPGADGADGAPGPIAGSDTQIAYNDGGSAAGSANLTWNKTTNTLYVGGAVSVSGGTVTASTPAINVVQTWNNAAVTFTGALVNVTDTASATASKLLDLQVGGVSKVSIRKDGAIIYATDNSSDIGAANATRPRSVYVGTSVEVGANRDLFMTAAGARFGSGMSFGWSTTTGGAGGSWAESFSRPASGTVALTGASILEQRNGASAQTFRLYGNYVDPASYSRLAQFFAVGYAWLEAQAAGSVSVAGLVVSAPSVYIRTGNSDRWFVSASGHWNAASHNVYDFGAAAAAARTGYFGTSVVTPAVKFPATQVASADPNTLDDYEEGTFTPTLLFGGANVGMTFNAQTGSYTKIGNRVDFRILVSIAAKGSSTGQLSVGTLPIANGGSANNHCAVAIHADGLTGISGAVQGYIATGSSVVGQISYSGTGTATTMTDANVNAGASLRISGTYFV